MTREQKKAKQKYLKKQAKAAKKQYYAIACRVKTTFYDIYDTMALVKLKPTAKDLIKEFETSNYLDIGHRIQAILSNNASISDSYELLLVKKLGCKIMSFESDDDALLWYEVNE